MPTYKISQLTTATAVSATNQFEINQNGTSKSVEVSVIDAYIKSTSNLPVVVSVSSASDALRITQTGTGKALVVEDSANPDATPFVIDASGNVGIGTASPDAALTVNTIASFGAGAAALPSIAAKGDLDTGMWFPAADTIAASTAGAERLRIDSSGNVGIGTSSPGAKLQVNGNLALGDAIITGTGTSTGDTNIEIGGNRTGSGNSFLDFHSTASTDFESRLIRSAGANGTFQLENTGTGNFTLLQGGAAPILFLTSGTERARITSGGDFLVGTTSTLPGYLNNTAGTSILSDGTASFSKPNNNITMTVNSGGSGNQLIWFGYQGTNVGSVSLNGTTGVLYNTTSDYRLKYDFTVMKGALSKVTALKPYIYKWKANNSVGEGFIAHELQEIIPQAVHGEKDAVNDDGSIKPQGVDYSKIVVHLVAAIQELKAENDDLKARLTALEAK